MRINLRFGMHRNVPLIREKRNLLDGLVIPANILAHQPAATSVFVASLSETPFFVDPMTTIFQSDPAVLNRLSMKKLCSAYGNTLSNRVSNNNAQLSIEEIRSLVTTNRQIIDFQLNQVNNQSNASGTAKYRKRYEKVDDSVRPRLVIPPYFRFDVVGDEWYEVSLEAAQFAKSVVDDVPVSPVICAPASAFGTGSVEKIVADFSGFDSIIFWFDDFEQSSVTVADIRSSRQVIQAFSDKNKVDVEVLFGGYLLMTAFSLGMTGVSHGILYSEHRSSMVARLGSGGLIERYYIPVLHEFRSLAQTNLIIHKHPELMCSCRICREEFDGDPDNIVLFKSDPELLRRHFLEVRHSEAQDLAKLSVTDLQNEFQTTYAAYHESFSEMPNPDAIVLGRQMRGLEFLRVWEQGLEGL